MTALARQGNHPWLESKAAYEAYYDAARVGSRGVYMAGYMDHFQPEPGESIVDLGCGRGHTVAHFARAGHDATGVECGQQFIYWARQAVLGLETARIDDALIEDWTPDRVYDWVLLTEVLEHVIDPVAILHKARESARKLFLTAPVPLVGTEPHVRGVPPHELHPWLQEAGWAVDWMALAPGGPLLPAEGVPMDEYLEVIPHGADGPMVTFPRVICEAH
jgi:SAM-dependent methyltransferase